MIELRGFTTIKSLVDNAAGVVPTLGELSQESATFSRDLSFYYHPTNTDFTYINMHRSRGDDTNIVISEEMLKPTMDFLDWLMTAGKDGTITTDKETFLNNWANHFPDMADEYESGEIRTEGEYFLPERVLWKKGDDLFEIFFADDVMETYWVPYHIEVIGPIRDIDKLTLTLGEVTPLLESRTLTTLLQAMNTVKADYPYTYNESVSVKWHQSDNNNVTTDTDWVLLQYGPNARNKENIRIAIRDWILAHSSHDETVWYSIYPDLFDPVLFYITPMWDKLAIPSLSVTAGVYSPIVNFFPDIKKVKRFTPYAPDHIEKKAEFIPTRYSCLSLSVVGSAGNKDGKELLSQIYPDYLHVATGHTDFSRQDGLTIEFSKRLIELVKSAEAFRPDDWLPDDVSVVVREGLVYLSTKIQGANFLMVTKESYLDILNGPESEIGEGNNPK